MSEAAPARRERDWKSGLRFLVSGGVNTAASWLLYALLLQVLPYAWSYTLAYCFGIALAYLLYRFYVFGRKGRSYGPLWVALIYFFQYLLGIGLVNVWIHVMRQHPLWAPLFSVLISLPLTFLFSRWVFRPAEKQHSGQAEMQIHD